MNISEPRRPAPKTKQRLFLILIVLLTLGLLVLFFSQLIIPFLSHQIRGDHEGARQVLQGTGWRGAAAVPLIEALQMAVVFIPAEFIQLSSGLAFPWYLAVPLCALGIFLGCSLIFLLVKLWHFRVARSQDSIERIQRKSRIGIYPFLTLLFFMPLIPFGAICYFGASRRDVKYGKFALTCTLSALPSIITSNVMGLGVRLFLQDAIPLGILILLIAAGMILLFVLVGLVLDRLYFKPAAGTPDSPWYDIMAHSMKLFLRFVVRTRVETNGLALPDGPALYVSNHPSAIDYPQVVRMLWPRRVVSIANEYFMRRGFLKKVLTAVGMIPKKLFVDEGGVILKARRTVKGGWSLYLAPEGRLSADGETYPILPSTGGFARFLNVPLVILHLSGAYYNKPKWRPGFRRQRVRIEVKAVIPPEELRAMTPAEVNARIREGIAADESARAYERELIWRRGNKAKGLPDLIYRCPVCGELYAAEAAGNELRCRSCGLSLRFDRHYRLEENPADFETVADLYRALTERERAERPSLSCSVTVRRFRGEEEDAGQGETFLSPEGFSFAGTVGGEAVRFSLTPAALKALPFSCGEEFETYYQNELYYFYPDEHREQCARWALLSDIYCEAYYEEE